jgi:hypothetical protein
MRLWQILIILSFFPNPATAQVEERLDSHIVWEHEFPNLRVSLLSTVVGDAHDGFWTLADEDFNPSLLLHISSDGQMLNSYELSAPSKATKNYEIRTFHLASVSSGRIGVLIDYSHVIGKANSFDGAKFGWLDDSGNLSQLNEIARPGPEYKEFVSLRDDDFLAIGDQAPQIVVRIGSDGNVIWRRRFPSSWVLPSAAPLEGGAACIVSGGYAKPWLHLIRLDKSGAVRRQTGIPARRGQAASGPDSVCAVLYDREPHYSSGQFFLATFDNSLHRVWTTAVKFPAPQGGVYHLLRLRDGYLVAADSNDSLFLAKYDFGGRLLWSVLDNSRRVPTQVAATSDGFYLIGGEQSGNILEVIRGR